MSRNHTEHRAVTCGGEVGPRPNASPVQPDLNVGDQLRTDKFVAVSGIDKKNLCIVIAL